MSTMVPVPTFRSIQHPSHAVVNQETFGTREGNAPTASGDWADVALHSSD